MGIGAVVEGNLRVAAGTAGCTSNGFLISTCVGYIIFIGLETAVGASATYQELQLEEILEELLEISCKA